MTDFSFQDDLEELSSAEDFLTYFEIPFEQPIVHVNRLHIMQRFHDYLQKASDGLASAADEEASIDIYKTLLQQAYVDFVESDAVTEKVFKVFKMHEPQTGFVSVEEMLGQ